MNWLPLWLAAIAKETDFPQPDDPGNPESKFTLGVEQARKLGVLISGLVDYIQVEYARCGKTEAP